jgi:hypothetical protein
MGDLPEPEEGGAPPVPDAAAIAGLLADDDRRRVVAALVLGSSTVDDVRAATGLSTRDVAVALARLVGGELVERSDDGTRVLRTYLRAGKLTQIPTQLSKRRVVLNRLAQEFDLGLRYSERQVNAILRRFHPDVAALRRYLVDEGFLDRSAPGEYWRAGGSVG